MATAIFPDNTVLINFACVDRLDLLEGWLRGRGRWTQAVRYEAEQSARYWPNLRSLLERGWLGEAIEPEEGAIASIERLRRGVFGGNRRQPLKHLGEAQTCYLIKHDPRWNESWWISDDRDALEFAHHQWITTRQTMDIFSSIVDDGDLLAEEAFSIMHKIGAHSRHLKLPRAPDQFR